MLVACKFWGNPKKQEVGSTISEPVWKATAQDSDSRVSPKMVLVTDAPLPNGGEMLRLQL